MADLKKIMAAIAADKPVQFKTAGGVWTDVTAATDSEVANLGLLIADTTCKWRLKPATINGVVAVCTLASLSNSPEVNAPFFGQAFRTLADAQAFYESPSQKARFNVLGYVRTTVDTGNNTAVSEFVKKGV